MVAGLAVTGDPVELLKLADGLQEYVVAPLTVNTVDWPLHIAALGETARTIPLTVIVTCAEAVQPLVVPITV